MHSAPAIRYPVARSAYAASVLAGLWTLAAAVCLWWWREGGATVPARLGSAGSLLLCAWVAWSQWSGMPEGDLRWDGRAWWWQASHEDERAVTVQVRVDLQHSALLRLDGLDARVSWCYVTRDTQPQRWDDLRRALHAPSAGVAS